jgi:hypothetical protein
MERADLADRRKESACSSPISARWRTWRWERATPLCCCMAIPPRRTAGATCCRTSRHAPAASPRTSGWATPTSGSVLGFDWANRHREAVKGLAYMEAILRPQGWDHWDKANIRSALKALRSVLPKSHPPHALRRRDGGVPAGVRRRPLPPGRFSGRYRAGHRRLDGTFGRSRAMLGETVIGIWEDFATRQLSRCDGTSIMARTGAKAARACKPAIPSNADPSP